MSHCPPAQAPSISGERALRTTRKNVALERGTSSADAGPAEPEIWHALPNVEGEEMDETLNAGRETSGHTTEATILVVDDEPMNLILLTALLQPHFRVRTARSGSEALAAIGTGVVPHLILLDVMMPDMDGYAVLRKLRESPAFSDIPVIFVTALASAGDDGTVRLWDASGR